MYIVYCIKNFENKIYIGQTNNFARRLAEHNNPLQGKKSKYTRNKGPWSVYYKEEFESREEALKKEKYLKSHVGRNYLRTLGS